MRSARNKLKHGRKNLRSSIDDLRYLQTRISGKSVYKRLDDYYHRKPKHRHAIYQYTD